MKDLMKKIGTGIALVVALASPVSAGTVFNGKYYYFGSVSDRPIPFSRNLYDNCLMLEADLNYNGRISLAEYTGKAMELDKEIFNPEGRTEESQKDYIERLRNNFRKADTNEDGFLDPNDFKDSLGPGDLEKLK